jgi:hypothetical protein
MLATAGMSVRTAETFLGLSDAPRGSRDLSPYGRAFSSSVSPSDHLNLMFWLSSRCPHPRHQRIGVVGSSAGASRAYGRSVRAKAVIADAVNVTAEALRPLLASLATGDDEAAQTGCG